MTLTGSRIISKTDHPGVCIFAEKAVIGQKDPATGVLCQILKKNKKIARFVADLLYSLWYDTVREKQKERES